MSGLAGIFNLDGSPVEPGAVKRLTDAISHRGPDGISHWIQGPVGLGFCRLRATHEAEHEKQPLADESGQYVLIHDGRVDNGDELKRDLDGRRVALRDSTDAELVLKTYIAFGDDAPRRILGDFAFAVWDGRRRELFCARDIRGARPLCYFTDGRRFVFGAEQRQLLLDPTIPRRPNEAVIAEHLAGTLVGSEETLYRDLLRLAPACFLRVGAGGLVKKQYWDIDSGRETRYRTDDQYADHLLRLLKESVRCRLRASGKAGIYLSGGVDSSSITCVAKAVLDAGGVPCTGVETFSLAFPGRACDEGEYAQAVLEACAFTGHRFAVTGMSPYAAAEAAFYLDAPDSPNGAMSAGLKLLARELGFRVMLTGYGGDEWFVIGPPSPWALLARGEWRTLAGRRRLYQQFFGRRAAWAMLLKGFLRPLLPAGVLRAVRRARGTEPDVPAGLNAGFVRRAGLKERLAEAAARIDPRDPKALLYASLRNTGELLNHERDERSSARLGLEDRHPFNDRRVIEYVFSVPPEQFRRGVLHKHILRHALRGLLPDKVRLRPDRGEFSAVLYEALQAEGGPAILERLSPAAREWVDVEQLRRTFFEMEGLYKQGTGLYSEKAWRLWNVFALDQWHRAVFGRGSPGDA
jgi:asparagine synthase (glutamine-hydrolysing)